MSMFYGNDYLSDYGQKVKSLGDYAIIDEYDGVKNNRKLPVEEIDMLTKEFERSEGHRQAGDQANQIAVREPVNEVARFYFSKNSLNADHLEIPIENKK